MGKITRGLPSDFKSIGCVYTISIIFSVILLIQVSINAWQIYIFKILKDDNFHIPSATHKHIYLFKSR